MRISDWSSDVCSSDLFGIEAHENVFETVAFLADPVLDRDFEVIDEELVRIDAFAAHLLDFARLAAAAVEIGVEQRDAIGGPLALFARRGDRKSTRLNSSH